MMLEKSKKTDEVSVRRGVGGARVKLSSENKNFRLDFLLLCDYCIHCGTNYKFFAYQEISKVLIHYAIHLLSKNFIFLWYF